MFELGKEGANTAHAWLLQHVAHILRWANAVGWQSCSGEARQGFRPWAAPLGREHLGGITVPSRKGRVLPGQE